MFCRLCVRAYSTNTLYYIMVLPTEHSHFFFFFFWGGGIRHGNLPPRVAYPITQTVKDWTVVHMHVCATAGRGPEIPSKARWCQGPHANPQAADINVS